MVQWLRLHAPNSGGLGSVPGQGTINRTHPPQLRPGASKNIYIYEDRTAAVSGENKAHWLTPYSLMTPCLEGNPGAG